MVLKEIRNILYAPFHCQLFDLEQKIHLKPSFPSFYLGQLVPKSKG